jgi:hypothetical protein
MRTVPMPFAAIPSASNLYVEAFTPSGLLPSRSVGPEPGIINIIGAAPDAGASIVPFNAPAGPGVSR